MEKFWECEHGILYQGDVNDCLQRLDTQVDMCITSPPYWAVRDYHTNNQLGMEPYVKDYINNLATVFSYLYPVIKDTGSFYLNIGDIYYGGNKGMGGKSDKQLSNFGSFHEGEKNYGKKFNNGEFSPKELLNIPNRVAIKLVDNVGWKLRNTIIWKKDNQFPTSVKDRFTMDFEYLFWFVKQTKEYYFEQQFEPFKSDMRTWGKDKYIYTEDNERDLETTHHGRRHTLTPNPKGRNKRCVWSINTESGKTKHFARYPRKLIETPIRACCPPGGTIIDPFMGTGTTAVEAISQGKKFIGFDINPEYLQIAKERIEEFMEV